MDILSRLTSLRIYCHREDGDRERTYDRLFAGLHPVPARRADKPADARAVLCVLPGLVFKDVEIPRFTASRAPLPFRQQHPRAYPRPTRERLCQSCYPLGPL